MQKCLNFTLTVHSKNFVKSSEILLQPGQVAPVGEAFREFKAIYDDEFFTLYNTNGVSDHHAAPKGSYLSACVHFSTLFHDSSSGNSYHGNLNNQVAKKLQDVADKVVNRGGWEYPTSSDCNLTMCQNIVWKGNIQNRAIFLKFCLLQVFYV